MADFLGGLLSGGGGLYDDLLTPQQQSQLSSRGLLAMAGAFADAGMPSRLPIPLGAAIGKAAAAMGTGRDQAALQVLQAQKLAQEVQTQKIQAALQQQMFEDFKNMPLSEFLKRHAGAAGSGAATPPAAAAQSEPLEATPGAPGYGRLTPPDIPVQPAVPSITQFGMPPRQNLSPYTGLRPAAPAALPPLSRPITAAERQAWIQSRTQGGQDTIEDWVAKQRAGAGATPAGATGSAPAPDDPSAGASLNDRYGGILAMAGGSGGASGSSLPPPDQLLGQGAGLGGLLSTASYGGGAGTPPFGPEGEIGSGGAYEDKRAQDLALVRKYESGGRNIMQNVVGPRGGYNPSVGRVTGPSSASGYYQMIDPTWRSAASSAGIDTAKYPRAIDAPPELQQKAAEALYDKRGLADWAPYNKVLARNAGWSGPMGDGGGSGGGAAPGASGGAPATAAAGGDGQGMNTLLLELARRNAMAEILKLGNPYGSMLSVLQGSPEYQAQIEAAKRAAGIPFIAPEKAAERSVTEPSDIRIAQAKTAADMAKDMALQGFMLDPKTNTVVPVPGYWDMMKGREEDKQRLQAEWQAKFQPVEATVLMPDGTRGTTKMTQYEFQQRQAAAANRARLGAGPQPGDIVETPVYPPGYEKATEVMLTQRRPKAEAAVQSLNFNETAQRLLDAGVITGWGAQLRLDVAKAKALFGWSNDKIANTEAFLSTQARQVAASLASGAFGSGSSITDNDRAYAAKMAGGDSNLDEASLRFLLRQNNTAARWEIDKYNADVKRHDPKGQLPILRVDEGPKAEAKPSGNQPTPLGGSQLNGKPYIKWSDGQWRPEGELPGQEK